MIIRHSDISRCLQNPRTWVAQLLRPSSSFIRTGYAGAVKLGIYRFHATNNERLARTHLESLFPRLGLTNRQLINEALGQFDSYLDWFRHVSPIVAMWRHRLKLDLGSGWFLGGELSRIDVAPSTSGYRAFILGEQPLDWRSDFRFPLIQRALSIQLHRKEKLISVGFQGIDGNNIDLQSYSKQQMDAAETRARQLAATVESEWRRQSRT